MICRIYHGTSQKVNKLYYKLNLERLLEIKIVNPFLWSTKTDIFRILNEVGQKSLIPSAVSCSQTSQGHELVTHCGGCSQCIDRRFAAYGSGLDDADEGGIYALDFVQDNIEENEVRTTLIDYVRQAKNFAEWSRSSFYHKVVNELVDLIDYVPGLDEGEKVNKIWRLCHAHGNQVETAIRRMREVHDNNLYRRLPENSFLRMIAEGEHFEDSIQKRQRDQTIDSRSQSKGIEVFCAYSHRDEGLREQLGNHLSILRRQGTITVWHDRKIGAGGEWEREIHEHLNTAHIILLLISSDFLASDYCYDIEMNRALERHDTEEACVIPIILRPVVWEEESLSRLLALPKDATAVTLWENQDEAFADIARGIGRVVKDINQT